MENDRSYPRRIEWDTDPAHLAVWKRGATGYPIVDAGTCQPREVAFVYGRVRVLVASSTTKDLLVDRRHGVDHFREHLVDHAPASDSDGWQRAASTGTDAQPYFRVFNPTTERERYDHEAEYVREYVPTLRGLDPEVIYSCHGQSASERGEFATDYPGPIVDHAPRREAASASFERGRGDGGD